jgi:LuxR family maltose regulon positive regulatory protein
VSRRAGFRFGLEYTEKDINMARSTLPDRARRKLLIPRVKTIIPQIPANFVPRDELRGRLEKLSAKFAITLLCAPAGYGKTLLLADWVANTGAVDKAWVSLDAHDNDARRFWSAVRNALCSVGSAPPSIRFHRLEAPETALDSGFYAEVIAEVVDEVAVLATPLYLVLDDLHEINSDETWHGLATLVRHQPGNMRLVLATRADPPLPLARLRVEGRLGELRARDLRFTQDQATELLRVVDVRLDREQVRRLVDQTDGWPAGLRLAARSLRGVSDQEAFLAEFAGHDRAIADFLVNEVLARLPTETTDVLTLVSVCDEVTPALAVALTGHHDAGAILSQLERDSSLVLAVGPERQWFRIHPLLRSYLQADLARQRPGILTELHETAANWFAEQEQPDKAVDHVTLTDESRTIVMLLRRYAANVLLTGDDPRAVRRALTKVGDGVVADDPELTQLSALAQLVAGEHWPTAGDRASVSALGHADPGADPKHLRQLVLTTHALSQGRPPAAFEMDWRDVVTAYDGADLEPWALLCHAWARLCAGDETQARSELDTAERHAHRLGLDYLTLHILSLQGVLSCHDGDIPTMAALCTVAIEIAAAHGWTSSPWLVADHLMIGLARLLRLDPAGALDETRLAAAALPGQAEPNLKYMIDVLTGAAYVDTGRHHDGLWLMSEARRNLGDRHLPPPVLVAGALLEHQCALTLGHDAQQIVRWTQHNVGDIAEVRLMHAVTAYAHDDLAGTEAALRGVLTGSLPAMCPTTPLDARLLETALEIRNDRRTTALTALETALTLAEPATLIRPFHQADASVRKLLRELAGGFDQSNGFVTRINRAVSRMADAADAGLTHREHAVLALLSSPKTIVEMASDLSVSVNTVKTHIRAIYAKLGVNSRRAAVVAGRHLGID